MKNKQYMASLGCPAKYIKILQFLPIFSGYTRNIPGI
jgi:hypothetical protein